MSVIKFIGCLIDWFIANKMSIYLKISYITEKSALYMVKKDKFYHLTSNFIKPWIMSNFLVPPVEKYLLLYWRWCLLWHSSGYDKYQEHSFRHIVVLGENITATFYEFAKYT